MYGGSRHQANILQNLHMRPSSLAPLHSDLGSVFGKSENYLFGTETNQCFVFGTRKFELSYLATS